ncbi:hypothetical protein PCANC_10924 [Puccinia coronata f. sp. avenae]|uniref:Uncharacterized protein n=1 Tax=Puccinia coronata f. sp. avenae TaxID=200324 RepID=A0A2N5SZW0_9BASI|nr:hypothetical protein PCANC_10924 [Puccinia coronata f. sp. avenae]
MEAGLGFDPRADSFSRLWILFHVTRLTRSIVPTAPCQRTRGVAWSVTELPHRVTVVTFDHVTRGGWFLVAESPSRSKIKLRTSDPSGCGGARGCALLQKWRRQP